MLIAVVVPTITSAVVPTVNILRSAHIYILNEIVKSTWSRVQGLKRFNISLSRARSPPILSFLLLSLFSGGGSVFFPFGGSLSEGGSSFGGGFELFKNR